MNYWAEWQNTYGNPIYYKITVLGNEASIVHDTPSNPQCDDPRWQPYIHSNCIPYIFLKIDGRAFMNGIPIADIIENPPIHSIVHKLMRKESSLCEPDINLSLTHGVPGTRALARWLCSLEKTVRNKLLLCTSFPVYGIWFWKPKVPKIHYNLASPVLQIEIVCLPVSSALCIAQIPKYISGKKLQRC